MHSCTFKDFLTLPKLGGTQRRPFFPPSPTCLLLRLEWLSIHSTPLWNSQETGVLAQGPSLSLWGHSAQDASPCLGRSGQINGWMTGESHRQRLPCGLSIACGLHGGWALRGGRRLRGCVLGRINLCHRAALRVCGSGIPTLSTQWPVQVWCLPSTSTLCRQP